MTACSVNCCTPSRVLGNHGLRGVPHDTLTQSPIPKYPFGFFICRLSNTITIAKHLLHLRSVKHNTVVYDTVFITLCRFTGYVSPSGPMTRSITPEAGGIPHGAQPGPMDPPLSLPSHDVHPTDGRGPSGDTHVAPGPLWQHSTHPRSGASPAEGAGAAGHPSGDKDVPHSVRHGH